MESKFSKIIGIASLVLIAIAIGLLIYQIFFYQDKDLQRLADIREQELQMLQRIEDMRENNGTQPEKKQPDPAPAPTKEIPLAPPPAAAKIETEEETK